MKQQSIILNAPQVAYKYQHQQHFEVFLHTHFQHLTFI